jgi:hypothetical protein
LGFQNGLRRAGLPVSGSFALNASPKFMRLKPSP